MYKDPIVEEKRKTQEKTYKKCKGNLSAYLEEIKKAASDFKAYKEKMATTKRKSRKAA